MRGAALLTDLGLTEVHRLRTMARDDRDDPALSDRDRARMRSRDRKRRVRMVVDNAGVRRIAQALHLRRARGAPVTPPEDGGAPPRRP